jgi:hypothetical protein
MVVDVLRTVGRARRRDWARSVERLAPWLVGFFLLGLVIAGAFFPYM